MHSQNPPLAVACRNIAKQFGRGATRVDALRGVNLDAYAGELTLLAGPSGCGKTTLLSIIAGILQPTDGDLTIFGTSPLKMSNAQNAAHRRKNIGFIFQQFNLIPTLTAVRNAAIPLVVAGVGMRQAVARTAEMFEKVGLSHRVNAMPSQMSGGEQQRVAIVRAMIHQPRLIICDEPTSALDGKTGQSVMELLRDMAVQPDRAVIVVTHDNRVFHFADRIAHLDDGQVVDVTSQTHAGPLRNHRPFHHNADCQTANR